MRYGCSFTSSRNRMPPLTLGSQGVPTSEHNTDRLPPQRVALRTCSDGASSTGFLARATSAGRSDLGSCQPVPSPCPQTMSSKQASMMSSGVSSVPKSSPSAGPAQVVAPVLISSAHCSAVKSLRPTKRGPFSTALAVFFLGGFGDFFVGQRGQDAREAVATARDQRHIGTTGRRAGDGRQARGVVAGAARGAGGRGLVDFH